MAVLTEVKEKVFYCWRIRGFSSFPNLRQFLPILRQDCANPSIWMASFARYIIVRDACSAYVCKPRAILRLTIKYIKERTSLDHGRSMFAHKTVRSARFTSRLRSTAHGFVLLTSLWYQLCNWHDKPVHSEQLWTTRSAILKCICYACAILSWRSSTFTRYSFRFVISFDLFSFFRLLLLVTRNISIGYFLLAIYKGEILQTCVITNMFLLYKENTYVYTTVFESFLYYFRVLY